MAAGGDGAQIIILITLLAATQRISGEAAAVPADSSQLSAAQFRERPQSSPTSMSISDEMKRRRDASPMKRLYDYLFETYNKDMRPVLNDSHTLNITVQYWFKQILKVQESDQVLTIYCWFEMYWTDDFLVWLPSDFGGITSIHVPARSIWQPDLLVYNNANMNVAENVLETFAIVSHNGRVSLFRSVITDITCNLDLIYFPFDVQVCYIMLASWSYDGSKMLLEPMAGDNLEFYTANNEWNLEQFKVRRNNKYYDCCPYPYPDISYYFILSRNPGYYILSLVIPSAFITVVTIVGFFTPYSSTGENTEKVSLGVTALLSMAIIMMMVADEMPATSKVMPLIGKYYIGLILILFTAASTTTITLSIQMRGINGKRPNLWLRRVFFDYLAVFPPVAFSLPEAPDRTWAAPVPVPDLVKDPVLVSERMQMLGTRSGDGAGDSDADNKCMECMRGKKAKQSRRASTLIKQGNDGTIERLANASHCVECDEKPLLTAKRDESGSGPPNGELCLREHEAFPLHEVHADATDAAYEPYDTGKPHVWLPNTRTDRSRSTRLLYATDDRLAVGGRHDHLNNLWGGGTRMHRPASTTRCRRVQPAACQQNRRNSRSSAPVGGSVPLHGSRRAASRGHSDYDNCGNYVSSGDNCPLPRSNTQATVERRSALVSSHTAESLASSSDQPAAGVQLHNSIDRRRRACDCCKSGPFLEVGQHMQQLSSAVEAIRTDMDKRCDRAVIAGEWRQVARIAERVLMLGFILFVMIYAGMMLSDRAAPVTLDDKLMDKLSKMDTVSDKIAASGKGESV